MSSAAPVVDWKKKYKDLKKRAKTLIFEQECLQQEVEKGQQKILKIQRDNSFLLERLSQYEQVLVDDPHDFDATDSSDNEVEPPPPPKKKKNLQSSSVKTPKVPPAGGDTQQQQVSKLGYDFKCRSDGSVKQEHTEQEIQQRHNCDISSAAAAAAAAATSVFVGSTSHVEGIVKQEAI